MILRTIEFWFRSSEKWVAGGERTSIWCWDQGLLSGPFDLLWRGYSCYQSTSGRTRRSAKCGAAHYPALAIDREVVKNLYQSADMILMRMGRYYEIQAWNSVVSQVGFDPETHVLLAAVYQTFLLSNWINSESPWPTSRKWTVRLLLAIVVAENKMTTKADRRAACRNRFQPDFIISLFSLLSGFFSTSLDDYPCEVYQKSFEELNLLITKVIRLLTM